MVQFFLEDKMQFLNLGFISWIQFSLVALVVCFLFFAVTRLQLYRKKVKGHSIGFKMFLYLLVVIILVAFILIRPIVHFALLLLIFGVFYKSILSYTKILFTLYYSKINVGDTIKIGDVSGELTDVNYGGLHISSNEGLVYFPFTTWNENKITLKSEAGKVLISFECSDTLERNEGSAIAELKKSLFNFPFLDAKSIKINKEADVFKVVTRISNSKYKEGFLSHIEKAGFRLNENKI